MEIKKKNYNLNKISQKYSNMWIAVSRDHKVVFGSAKSLKDLARKIKGRDVVFLKLPPSKFFYMPSCYEV